MSIQSYGSLARRRSSAKALRQSSLRVVEQLESRTLLTAVLSPTADTFVRNNIYATTNFGQSPLLYVQNASAGDSRVTLMTFDLSSISSVTSAVLQVEGSLAAPDSTAVTVDAYAVDSAPWVEGAGTITSRNGNGNTVNPNPTGPITWNNEPTVSTNPVAVAPVSINRYGMQSYSWDLTSTIQQLFPSALAPAAAKVHKNGKITGVSDAAAAPTTVTIALEGLTTSANWAQFLSRESGSFGPHLVINGTGASAPVATPSAPDITDTNAAAATFPVTVTYSSDAPIDMSTIAAGNISVSGPAGSLQVLDASSSQGGDGNTIAATYDVAAPAGGWVNTDNGIYTITVNGGQVAASGQGTAATAESQFRVAVNDSAAPMLSVSAPDVTVSGATTYQFTVTATDNVAVDPSWVDVDNVQVLTPGGQPLTVLSAQADSSTPGGSRTFTYTVATPDGGWALGNNGAYTINVLGSQLRDTAGNAAPAATASFNVAIPTPDTAPPTAVVSAPAITSPGGINESVTVTYTDNVAISLASIAAGNITVTGPSGTLHVTGVELSATGNGSPITAIYTVAAPGGVWDASDNGGYTVNVVAGSVKDTSGNGVVAATGTFQVAATLPDTTPPNAQITADNITTTGAAAETITIVYTDNVAVKASTISGANISVTGPSGALTVLSAQASGGDGSPLRVTYTVGAPHGTWASADNGNYTIALKANQVSDVTGNFSNGALGSFAVNIPTPIDTGPSDGGFNNGQPVSAPFVTEAMVTQPDGKILAVGREGDLTAKTSRGVIERFNADGTVDGSFGTHGMIASQVGANEAYYAVIVQDASHFLVAGTSNGDFVLTRYDLTGALDTTFGTSGRTIVDFGATDAARSIALTSGNIIVGGDSGNNFAFARFDASGHLDSTFAQNGRQLFALGANSSNGLSVIAIQTGGAVVATGSMGSQVVVVRLTASGEADGTFGNGGLVIVGGLVARTDLKGPDRSVGLALQPNGAILVANSTATGDFGLVRLAAGGTMDPTFGNNGIVTANFGGDDDADAIIVQNAGQIIVVGTSLTASAANTAVAAYDANGNALTGFGSNGLLTLPSGLTLGTTTSSSGKLSPQSLHVGDIVLRAFGTVTADGRVVIGTSNDAVASTTSSTLRRLIVPGAIANSPAVLGTLLGSFGIVGGKIKKFTPTGTHITFSMTGGTGKVYDSNGRYTLVIDQLGSGISVTITSGGGKRVSLQDVTISGTLKSFTAPTADIFGTFSSTGAMGRLSLGDINGSLSSGAAIGTLTARNVAGTVFATAALGTTRVKLLGGTLASGQGVIGNVYATSLNNARILSGVNLGSDLQIGGSGSAADVYNPGSIKGIYVTKTITSSIIGAGVNPVDNTFGNNDDIRAAGGGADSIQQIHAHSVDQASRFEAGVFGKVLIPKLVKPASDPRFTILPTLAP